MYGTMLMMLRMCMMLIASHDFMVFKMFKMFDLRTRSDDDTW